MSGRNTAVDFSSSAVFSTMNFDFDTMTSPSVTNSSPRLSASPSNSKARFSPLSRLRRGHRRSAALSPSLPAITQVCTTSRTTSNCTPHTPLASISSAAADASSAAVHAVNPPSSAPAPSVNTASATASQVPIKPASDVVAGAVARAASQSTIHPIDTLKVRLQTTGVQSVVKGGLGAVTSLYKGVAGAATGAGIALGAYFACYGLACNTLSLNTKLSPSAIAFLGGGIAAAGSSVVKVPIAVCIRSVQAGVYPNALGAARSIIAAAGPRGLFTGYLPTLLEDVPDMAFKFAAYETLKQMHRAAVGGRAPSMAEDFALGATAGACAAAATTPLDVIKTNMMCTAAGRPTMTTAAKAVMMEGGFRAFFRGIAPRAASNGVNSAVFFAFFEALRKAIKEREAERVARVEALAAVKVSAPSGRRGRRG